MCFGRNRHHLDYNPSTSLIVDSYERYVCSARHSSVLYEVLYSKISKSQGLLIRSFSTLAIIAQCKNKSSSTLNNDDDEGGMLRRGACSSQYQHVEGARIERHRDPTISVTHYSSTTAYITRTKERRFHELCPRSPNHQSRETQGERRENCTGPHCHRATPATPHPRFSPLPTATRSYLPVVDAYSRRQESMK